MRITPTHVYFFTEKDEFSNWYRSDFTIKGITFNCIEQYMMYAKAKLFGDHEIAEKILKEPQPASQKALGRKVKNYSDDIWHAQRKKIVTAGLVHKFGQNEYLKECLLNTGSRTMVEASKYDKIWGCGLSEDNPKIDNSKNWPGLNLLGECLEQARFALRPKVDKSLENKEAQNTNERKYWSGEKIDSLQPNQVFVFGSNPEGRHGAGAAAVAMKFGAKYGIGRGLVGDTYAIITKNLTAGFVEKATGIQYPKEGYKSVTEEQIKDNIKEFYETAKENPNKEFLVTYKYDTWPNGKPKKSLNGYDPDDFIKLFKSFDIPSNVIFHESYKNKIENDMNNKKQNKLTM